MSTSFALFNTLIWLLLATIGDAVSFGRGTAILRRLASASSLTLKPILANGQSSCSNANPCGIAITGYDEYQGIPTATIELKAGESWIDRVKETEENVLYFKEVDYEIAGGKTVGFVAYFFDGYYDDDLYFAWYDTKGTSVKRSKIIGINDVIALAEHRMVAKSSYWTTSFTPVVNYRYILPKVAGDTEDTSGDTGATGSTKSSLRVEPVLANGQSSCSDANPCGIEISGYDAPGSGIPVTTIELKAGKEWTGFTQNVLYFKEVDYDIAGGRTVGHVAYFFTGYYDNVLHFEWYKKQWDVDAKQIEVVVVRSKVLSSGDLVALCETSDVAYEPYYRGNQLFWKIVKPLTYN